MLLNATPLYLLRLDIPPTNLTQLHDIIPQTISDIQEKVNATNGESDLLYVVTLYLSDTVLLWLTLIQKYDILVPDTYIYLINF